MQLLVQYPSSVESLVVVRMPHVDSRRAQALRKQYPVVPEDVVLRSRNVRFRYASEVWRQDRSEVRVGEGRLHVPPQHLVAEVDVVGHVGGGNVVLSEQRVVDVLGHDVWSLV